MRNLGHGQTSVEQHVLLVREDLRKMITQGKLNMGIAELDQAIRDLHLQQFDLNYVAGNYAACAKALAYVGDSPKAYERFVYLYAHAPGYRDEKALQRVVEELGNDNPHAVTAMALSACEPGSAIDPDDVHRLAQKILEPRDLEYASHSDAYLLLCCGKLALAKQDFDRALEYFDKGDKAYPQGSYSFRRAELHLCRADAFESLGDLWKALQASGRALVAAHEQVRLESDNPQWARLERKATERRAELEIKNFQSMQIPER